MFITKRMKELLAEDCSYIRDEMIEKIYVNCFKNTWETTLTIEEGETTYVITGDIPAMWLRDSSLQVLPYLRLLDDSIVRRAIKGLVLKQAEQVLIDPYANAFNKNGDYSCFSKDHTKMGAYIWERKYEADSLAFPMLLLEEYYKRTKDTEIFTDNVIKAIHTAVDTWTVEQRHSEKSQYLFQRDSELSTETLQNNGKGTTVKYTGMTWSGFRPSDDACTYHYLIPSNMLVVCALQGLSQLLIDKEILEKATQLAEKIKQGIYRYGIVRHPKYGEIFAYETDGLGNHNLMDDANLPSLLGAAWYGFCDKQDSIYQNTRKFILSRENPCFFEGKYAEGIGSPHTPDGNVWPIAMIVQGLTAEHKEEQMKILKMLCDTTAGKDYMHESFCVDDPGSYTREWFAWANAMFSLLVISYYELEGGF